MLYIRISVFYACLQCRGIVVSAAHVRCCFARSVAYMFDTCVLFLYTGMLCMSTLERWGARVETQKNVRGEIGGWGRVPFNETYAPSLSTIYDGA